MKTTDMIHASQFSPIKHQVHPHTSRVSDQKTYPLNNNVDSYIFRDRDCKMQVQRILT